MTKYTINKNDIIYNFTELSHKTGALIIPTLKANAYGLGASEVAKLLRESFGVPMVAISTIDEYQNVCDCGAKALLLSCYHDEQSVKYIVDNNIIAAVDTIGQAKRIGAYASECQKTASVHIKIDTGFGRYGFLPQNLDAIKAVFAIDGIKVEGIFSHFSSAFAKNQKLTEEQFEKFTSVCDSLTNEGYNVGIRHIANSSAFFKNEKYHLDAVRIGSALTGRLPFAHKTGLKRVGVFTSTITEIRTLKKGKNIGYGNIAHLKKDTRVAVVATGAADGVLIKKDYDTFRLIDILRYGFGVFKLIFKNGLTVRVNGKQTKTVGRGALTHTFVDVTNIDCAVGDSVEFNISPLYVSANVKREYID